MKADLDPAQLLEMRETLWAVLEKRYPSDPTIGLVKSIDRQLAAIKITNSALDPVQDKAIVKSSSDSIAEASQRLFRTVFTEPVYSREILAQLRKEGVPLPDDDDKATAAIGAVFAKRPQFKKFPGAGKKATAKWHLAR